jgi:diacylglycerol O-acyltransferase
MHKPYKLAGLDAAFLYSETARSPQHIASIQIVEIPAGREPGELLAEFKATVLGRLHLVPYFTNRLQETPFGLDHPVWVRDPHFDIDRHVIAHPVAAPGGRAEFEAAIAELHATPLDRSRPLWEIRVLTGLAGGRIAYYNRVHHACLDGVSGQAAVAALLDASPDGTSVPAVDPAFRKRPTAESFSSLMIGAFENLARYQIRRATRLMGDVETLVRVLQRGIDPNKGFGAAVDLAPATRFNRPVQSARTYATGEFPLVEVRGIAKAAGATLNDVVLAICSGGLRRYLLRHGELPARSLIAGCPVSLRRPGDRSLNNQVTMMQVGFATDEPDPRVRLLKIVRSSRQAKGLVADLAGSYDADLALPGLPALLSGAARLLEGGNLQNAPPAGVPFNMVVSNVPGPREPLYSLGGRVLTHYPVSIPAHGQAVNVTVQSYADQLFLGITGCARALPDAQRFRDDLLDAHAELMACVLGVATAPPAGGSAPPKALPRRDRTTGAMSLPARAPSVQPQVAAEAA